MAGATSCLRAVGRPTVEKGAARAGGPGTGSRRACLATSADFGLRLRWKAGHATSAAPRASGSPCGRLSIIRGPAICTACLSKRSAASVEGR